jgi:hypothetical protein
MAFFVAYSVEITNKKQKKNIVKTSKKNCFACSKPFIFIDYENNTKPSISNGRCCDMCNIQIAYARMLLITEIIKTKENYYENGRFL